MGGTECIKNVLAQCQLSQHAICTVTLNKSVRNFFHLRTLQSYFPHSTCREAKTPNPLASQPRWTSRQTDRQTDQQRNGHTRWEGSVVEGGLFWGSLPGGPQPRHQKQHPPKGDKWHWLHGTWPAPIPGKAHLAGVGPHSQGWGAGPQLGAKARGEEEGR